MFIWMTWNDMELQAKHKAANFLFIFLLKLNLSNWKSRTKSISGDSSGKFIIQIQ